MSVYRRPTKNRATQSALVTASDVSGQSIAAKMLAASALARGKTITRAAKVAGVSRASVYNWMKTDEGFKQELSDQLSQLKAQASNLLIDAGVFGTHKLRKLATRGKEEKTRLRAATALHSGLVAAIRADRDMGPLQVAPLFQLPGGSSVHLDVTVGPTPDTPASEVIDAELVGAHEAPEDPRAWTPGRDDE